MKKTKTKKESQESKLLLEWEKKWRIDEPVDLNVENPLDMFDNDVTAIDEHINSYHSLIRERHESFLSDCANVNNGVGAIRIATDPPVSMLLEVIRLMLLLQVKIDQWEISARDLIQAAAVRGRPTVETRWQQVLFEYLNSLCTGPLQENLHPHEPDNDEERSESSRVWFSSSHQAEILDTARALAVKGEPYPARLLKDLLSRLRWDDGKGAYELMGKQVRAVPKLNKPKSNWDERLKGLSKSDRDDLDRYVEKLKASKNVTAPKKRK